MKLQPKKNVLTWLLFLTVPLWQGLLYANHSEEALCEKLYVDSLQKAKKALAEKKRDDALRFLLDAAALTEHCASVPEEPHRREQGKNNELALFPARAWPYLECSLRISSISLGSTDWPALS